MIKLTEEEKKLILSLHDKEKKIIKEQTDPVIQAALDFFKTSKEEGCLRDTSVEYTKLYRSNRRPGAYYVKGPSKSVPGGFKRIYNDKTWEVVDDKNQVVKSGTWACNIKPKPVEPVKPTQDQQTEIEQLKREGGWKEKSEMEDKINLENPNMYEKMVHKGTGIVLYRQKTRSNVTGSLTANQQSIIDRYEQQGWRLDNELDEYEKSFWRPVDISANHPGVFSGKFVMYWNPNTAKDTNKETPLKDLIQGQTINRQACKSYIEDYWEMFKSKMTASPAEITKAKEIVQRCLNQYYGDWGFMGRGNKWDAILDVLSRKTSNYDGVNMPTNAGEDSIYRLKAKR